MLNFENVGKPLAVIVDEKTHRDKTKRNGKRDPKFNKVVSIAEDYEMDKVKNPMTHIDLPNGQIFQQVPNEKEPNHKLRRRIIYTSGKSGSGKTYYTADYVREYVRQSPKNRILLFSSLESDETLDEIKQVRRVKVKTAGFVNETFTIDQFKDTLVIFDDTDCIKDKGITAQINHIADIVLQTGRHTNTSMIFTSHLSCAGKSTQLILCESHSIVFFPSAMTSHALNYLCTTYIGLDKKQVKMIQKDKSRWVTYFKGCPPVLMFKNKMCFVADYGDANMKKSADSNNDDSIIEEPVYKSNDKYLCKTCNVKVLYRNKQRHEQTAKHLKNA
jgi:hypothetical protein